jgi:hypothetical protein
VGGSVGDFRDKKTVKSDGSEPSPGAERAHPPPPPAYDSRNPLRGRPLPSSPLPPNLKPARRISRARPGARRLSGSDLWELFLAALLASVPSREVPSPPSADSPSPAAARRHTGARNAASWRDLRPGPRRQSRRAAHRRASALATARKVVVVVQGEGEREKEGDRERGREGERERGDMEGGG